MGSKTSDNIMDVDASPHQSSNQFSNSSIIQSTQTSSLKRCSSAPMINEMNSKVNTAAPNLTRNVFSKSMRYKGSFSPQAPTAMSPRLTPRVNQLRHEEAVDVTNVREVAHEREIHSAMQMSQSWEDLTLMTDSITKSDEMKTPRMLPLNISLPTSATSCSSPSPTRSGLTRFSPSLHMEWKMSPSPTRKSFTTRRSLSPIAMRPSSLGQVKRKFDLDEENKTEYLGPPAKRMNSFGGAGGLLIANGSPLPSGSLSSVGTPESLSSADSPSFQFHPIDSPPTPRAIVDEPMDGKDAAATRTKSTKTQSSV